MKRKRMQKTFGNLTVPDGMIRLGRNIQEGIQAGERRPNSIAWAAGDLFISVSIFGWAGTLILLL